MTANATQAVTLEKIEELLTTHGFELVSQGDGTLVVRDPESEISVTLVLEQQVLYFSVSLISVARVRITPELLWRMLAADNGISTSSFQLYELTQDRVVVALNNFCKLLGMGEEDKDDILSCIGFLLADVYSARTLLTKLEN